MCLETLTPPEEMLYSMGAGTLYNSGDQFGYGMLLRWNTEDLPSEMDVTQAWLRMAVILTNSDDPGATLVADWYTWAPSCDATDATGAAADPALDGCGAACELANLSVGTYVDLPLDAADTHIARGEDAITELRIGVDADEESLYGVFATIYNSTGIPGPGLVVEVRPSE